MKTRTDKSIAALYASLTPVERSRLIARSWREHTGDLDAIRDAIPDSRAGHAYNRAVTILGELHDATPPMILAISLGIEKWLLLAGITYDIAAARRTVLAYLHRIWRMLTFPVTEVEFCQVRELHRAELVEVEDYLIDICFEEHMDAPRLHPALTDVWRGGTCADGSDETELRKRTRRVIRSATKDGTLPTPTCRSGSLWLPEGVLSDWALGTTPETFRLFNPAFYVPEVELFGGGMAEWDIRPDDEWESVRAKRTTMLEVFASIARDGGNLDVSILAEMTLDLPATAREWERRRDAVQAVWPWAMGDALRDELRTVARGLRSSHTELRIYRETIAQLQEQEFGGEDPLDARVREWLDRAEEIDAEAVRLWAATTEAARPWGDSVTDWPPSLDDDDYFAAMQPVVLRHLCQEWEA